MLTVAQLVELQIVVLVVVSSILIRQPNRGIVQLGRTRALGAWGRRFKSCYPYHAGVAQLGFDSCHQLHTKEIVSENKIVLYMLIIAILTGILYGKILAILYI